MQIQLLNEYKLSPMSANTTWLLLQLARANDAQAQAAWEKVKSQPSAFLLEQRLGSRVPSIDRRILTVVASMCRDPKGVVLWAHTLYHLSLRNGAYYYLAAFTTDFALGFPDDAVMADAWTRQKETNPPGNYLDKSEAWQ